jgi:SAM-dependent methyltransferase
VNDVAEILGFFGCLKPSNVIDVGLQNLFQRKSKKVSVQDLQEKLKTTNQRTDIQAFLIKRLYNLISKFRTKTPVLDSSWIDYSSNNTYTEESKRNKEEFIKSFLLRERPSSVLDMGCNTGEYSRLAAKYVKTVLALDADHNCIDALYNLAKKTGEPIQTLWMDIANPTPAMGFNCLERKSIFDRVKCDAVMALALVHHLLISSGARPALIRDCLFALGTKFVLVEYVHPSDVQFRSLVGLRQKDYSFFTEDFFKSFFSKRGSLISKIRLSPTRSLFLFRKKS